jgi:hypothetical protein
LNRGSSSCRAASEHLRTGESTISSILLAVDFYKVGRHCQCCLGLGQRIVELILGVFLQLLDIVLALGLVLVLNVVLNVEPLFRPWRRACRRHCSLGLGDSAHNIIAEVELGALLVGQVDASQFCLQTRHLK